MKFKNFIGMYDDWNGVITVNDDDLNTIIRCNTNDLMFGNGKYYNFKNIFYMKVVSFGVYGNEICVRVKGEN